jgi:glutathione peroxidase
VRRSGGFFIAPRGLRPTLHSFGLFVESFDPSGLTYRMMSKSLLGIIMLASSAFAASSVHEFTMKSIEGRDVSLGAYQGKVLLIVNVASKCGFTPQYAGLQALYSKYQDEGLVVLGVPANNFGSQEPGSDEEIKTFCTRTYNVKFPMMSKVSVKGGDKTPLYQYLTDTSANPSTGGEIQWNFTKFLIGKDGKPVARFNSKVAPDSPELVSAVEKALGL